MVHTMETATFSETQADSDSQVEDRKRTKRKISLACCGVCGTEEARYRCPGCMKHSCSLPCVKKHKALSGCSGVRDKTAFVSLSQFNERNLLNDYRFLEDAGRMADGANRDSFIRQPQLSQRAKKLTRQARGAKVTLKVLPQTFTKSRENSTFFHKKEGRFYWHLKLLFPLGNSEYTERRVTDNRTLAEILSSYIHPTESDPVRRQKLKMYVHAPRDHVRVFMKAEERRPNSPMYHELDVKKSLRDNLMYKTIIEFPLLHVALKGHCQDYLTQRQAARAPPAQRAGPGEGWRPQAGTGPQSSPHNPTAPEGTQDGASTGPKGKRVKLTAKDDEMEDGEIQSEDDGDGGDGSGDACHDRGPGDGCHGDGHHGDGRHGHGAGVEEEEEEEEEEEDDDADGDDDGHKDGGEANNDAGGDPCGGDGDELAEKVTTDQLAEKVTTDQLAEEVTTDQLAEEVTTDQLAEEVTTDQLAEKVTTDQLAEEVTTDQLAEEVTTDQLAEEVVTDQLAEEVTTDQLAEEVTTDQLAEKVTTDQLAEEVVTGTSESAPATNE